MEKKEPQKRKPFVAPKLEKEASLVEVTLTGSGLNGVFTPT